MIGLEEKIKEAEMIEAVLLTQIRKLATFEQKELSKEIEDKYGVKPE